MMVVAPNVAVEQPSFVWPNPFNAPKIPGLPTDQQIVGGVKSVGSGVVSGTEALGQVAEDVVNPNWWLRVGEFAIGAILITVGIAGMTRAGQHARSAARSTERTARVAYSVTPQGSRINRVARSTARTARRSRA